VKISDLLESTNEHTRNYINTEILYISELKSNFIILVEHKGYEYARKQILSEIHESQLKDWYLTILVGTNPKLQKSFNKLLEIRNQVIDKINSGL